MEARELRIGNLVQYDLKTGSPSVCNLDIEDLGYIMNNPESPIYTGMPLTGYWLEKLQFKNIGSDTFTRSGIELSKYLSDYSIWKVVLRVADQDVELDTSVQYIHELQNLFFVLTGEEL